MLHGLRPQCGQLVEGPLMQLGRRLVRRQGRDPVQPLALQLEGVGQRRVALVQHQRDRVAGDGLEGDGAALTWKRPQRIRLTFIDRPSLSWPLSRLS